MAKDNKQPPAESKRSYRTQEGRPVSLVAKFVYIKLWNELQL